MYREIRTYELLLGTREECIQHVQERLVPLLSHVPGFRDFSLVEIGDNHVTFIITFHTQGDARAPAQLMRSWIAEHADFMQEVTQVAAGELRVLGEPVRVPPTIRYEEELLGLFGYAQ
jgi:hypothetical protein